MIEIENATLLSDLFGHWPDFHDAEVRAVRLASPGGAPASLELDVEVAERSAEVDAAGYYRDRQRCQATLRFGDVADASLTGFGAQNVLDELDVAELTAAERAAAARVPSGPRRYRVRCVAIPGFCDVELLCDTVAVVAARPVARAPGAGGGRSGARPVGGASAGGV